MSKLNNIHDTFFRETMSHKEVAADFLTNYLPATVLEHIKNREPEKASSTMEAHLINGEKRTWESLGDNPFSDEIVCL